MVTVLVVFLVWNIIVSAFFEQAGYIFAIVWINTDTYEPLAKLVKANEFLA